MATKYSSWDKTMLSFTVPSSVTGKTIKRGRYTKLRYLIEMRAYVAKLISNMTDVKYFMNIELGTAYSNPHLHVQLWCENQSITSSNLIMQKTIKKFSLDSNRCIITYPEKDLDIYHYVIKDYSKNLSDKELWDLEIQKKRMRDTLGSKVRFYSKSGDKYTKKIYRILWRYYSCAREYANEFIDKFISMFFIKTIPQLRCLDEYLSKLCISIYIVNRTSKRYVFSFIFYIIPCSLSPPLSNLSVNLLFI